MQDNLWIDVKIPYEPGDGLAHAYNRALENTLAEWVLLVDHDIFLDTNPHWYEMCLDAIRQLEDKKIGWITAKCNRIACKAQLPDKKWMNYIDNLCMPNEEDNILQHINIAKQIYKEKGQCITETDAILSGFFILTNKTAWKSTGGFKDVGKGLLGIDNEYCRCLTKKGFGLYVMEGLYFYHLYRQKTEAFKDF